MSLQLFTHPFSFYCRKTLIALYEHAMPFELRMLDAEHPVDGTELEKDWPLKRFPVLLAAFRWMVEEDATSGDYGAMVDAVRAQFIRKSVPVQCV